MEDFNSVQLEVVSQDFQWLPTDFAVATTGEVTCRGYVNKLHPIEHRVLYSPITSLQCFVPMIEKAFLFLIP